ncbi:MAG: dimethyl sulfoxide reductase anchor subunit [Gammaproteobacteria bacterium]|nr:dimethyl sulfoxide reductase anchor subunit [Gammaproteobacteria bacterium]
MHPALSVIFLTTLIGAGQGLFLALFTGESYAAINIIPEQRHQFFAVGGLIVLMLLIAGLVASFFHLGHPERAWRAVTQWRTSWLSREVIILPLVMLLVALWSIAHYLEWNPTLLGMELGSEITLTLGAVTSAAVFLLYIATAMIYASIRFLREWASPLTVINFTLLGAASGFLLATAYATNYAQNLVNFYGGWAMILTLAAWFSRSAALIRNARLKPKSTIQSAIGIRHSQIAQKSMGMMGGSYNTREYFHGASRMVLRLIKWLALVLTFPLPLLLIWFGMSSDNAQLILIALFVQYLGLLFERWLFFAQANHPQNIYYQTVG